MINLQPTTYNLQPNRQNGQAVMTIVFFMLFLGGIGVLAFSYLALNRSKASRDILISEKSYYLAESGTEDVIYRMNNGKSYSAQEIIVLDGYTATTTTTTVGAKREIETLASVQQNFRKIKSVLETGGGVSFVYGVQLGRGGFFMENGATLNGSVYTTGNIILKDSAKITGDTLVASTSYISGGYNGNPNDPKIQGNARAHYIFNANIFKNATSTTVIAKSKIASSTHADIISGDTIGINAYYQTSIATSSVGMSSYPGTPAPADLPILDFPISDQQISDWETAAEAGGTHTSPCPYIIEDDLPSTYLGPLKINCDFTVQNDGVVILQGPVWVVGSIDIKNDGQIKIDPSYGANSEVLIADNPSNRLTSSKILIQNNAKVLGSGSSGSHIILISQNNSAETGGNEVAIQSQNNQAASVFYTSHGKVLIENNTALKEVTAYLVHMKNNAVLTYESGLSDITFSSGPQGGYVVEEWREVE